MKELYCVVSDDGTFASSANQYEACEILLGRLEQEGGENYRIVPNSEARQIKEQLVNGK